MANNFNIGRVIATDFLWEIMNEDEGFKAFVSICLSRYISCDWGDICPDDWEVNDKAVIDGGQVIAVYYIPEDVNSMLEEQLWIVTEPDRSVTTLMFLSDY